MKYAFTSLSRLVLAGFMAAAGSAMAEGPTTAPAAATTATGKHAGHHGGRHHAGHRDPAQLQARMAKHHAELKAQLKIAPAQEAAWTRYTAAMQPAGHMMGHRSTAEQRAEFDKLTTPERIDKMRAMRIQHMTEMSAALDQRGEATKALYAALSPEQQKMFDDRHRKMGRHHGRG
ncbi:MAG: hypothetical protein JWR68_185 [Polaromonas sp.]|nr:hypothetical protein [Polaromonas sp.]